MTEILNIIESSNGIIQSLHSFVINTDDKKKKEEIIGKANDCFKSLIKKVVSGISENDLDEAVGNKFYRNTNGVEMLITWSSSVTFQQPALWM